MDIIRTSLPIPSTASSPAQTPTAPALKLGDTLGAVVQARLSATSYLLQLQPSGTSVVAQSETDLLPGAQLKLEVTKLGTTPELKLTANSLPSHAPAAETPHNQALRQFLPKQIELTEFTAGLLALDSNTTQSLPAPVKQALANVLAAFPQQRELATPPGLMRAMRDSGVFFEARLAAAVGMHSSFPDGDLKGRLLALLSRLQTVRAPLPVSGSGESSETHNRPLPDTDDFIAQLLQDTDPAQAQDADLATRPELAKADSLARKVEGALARISLDQLDSLPKPEGAPLWRLEIPYTADQHSDTAKLLISGEGKRGDGNTGRNWSINLELHPPGLGSFCARIVFAGGKIDTYLWSDQPDTVNLISANSEQLRARLEQAGLAVGHLTALAQAPASSRNDTPAVPLLDLRV